MQVAAKFTVEGRPFYVRRDSVIAIGSAEDGITLLTVNALGTIPVEETLPFALTIWDGSV